MRSVILYIAMSLDGYIADREGGVDWLTGQDSAAPSEEEDFELKRLVSMFKLLREKGYTLRILPGTPEENAPVFDPETETILRPAA